MSWFEEQIKQRTLKDEEQYRRALFQISDAVQDLGKQHSDINRIQAEMKKILVYYRSNHDLKEVQETLSLRELAEILEPYEIVHRTISLKEKWYKDADGPILGTFNGKPVVFMIGIFGTYWFNHPDTGKKTAVTDRNEGMIGKEAMCFYRSFPNKSMEFHNLIQYCLTTLHIQDLILLFIAMAVVTAMGMTLPHLNSFLIEYVIPGDSSRLLYYVTGIILTFAIGMSMMGILKRVLLMRIQTKISIAIESAAMLRVLSIPFYITEEYSTGELTNILQFFSILCNELLVTCITTGLTLIFSLTYLLQIHSLTPEFSFPAQCITIIVLIHMAVCMIMQSRINKELFQLAMKERGMEYSLISGIQKIKLSGSEKRMFTRWADLFAQKVRLKYRPYLYLKLAVPIGLGILLAGTIWIYVSALQAGTTKAQFFAFSASFGVLAAALKESINTMMTVAELIPVYRLIRPVLEAEPENSEKKKKIQKLSGKIEMNHVTFRYQKDGPEIIEDLSLTVHPGEYVAIVGESGCGKTTLIRLLLKFCTPEKGSICYDGIDISGIEETSLRRRIGTVLQNGSLFLGDIFTNIAISSPDITLDEAWEATEMAGIADDIRNMPMEMHTLVNNQNNFSGGQVQRIMIARALAGKPDILILDEATSALDNLTQKQVSDAVGTLKCTRIVIAHRLSTIRLCDRIIVLDKGKVAEEGTYEELMEKQGLFSQLAKRQILEQNSK